MPNWGALVGVARGLSSDLEKREARQREEELLKREEDKQHRQYVAGQLEDIVKRNDSPEPVISAAAQGLFAVMTDPKMNAGKREKLLSNVLMSARRERAMNTLGIRRLQPAASGAQLGSGASATGGTGTASGIAGLISSGIQSAIANAPTTTITSPFYTQEERRDQALDTYEEQQQLQQRYATPPKPTGPLVIGADQTAIDPSTGQVIARGVPRRENQTEFETYMSADPATRARMEADRRRWTSLDDRPRESGGGGGEGKPVRLTRSILQQPDGSMVEVLTNPYDPAEPAVIRPLGKGLDKPMGGAEKDKLAEFQNLIASAESAQQVLATTPEATGPFNNFLYGLRRYGILGQNDPQVVTARADISRAASDMLHRLSGAAISPMEMKRLERSIPTNFNENHAEFMAKVNAFVTALKRTHQLRYGPGGRGTPQQFPGDVEASSSTPLSRPGVAPAPAPGNGTRRRLSAAEAERLLRGSIQ